MLFSFLDFPDQDRLSAPEVQVGNHYQGGSQISPQVLQLLSLEVPQDHFLVLSQVNQLQVLILTT